VGGGSRKRNLRGGEDAGNGRDAVFLRSGDICPGTLFRRIIH
jgi:hypothetical protein